MPVMLPAAGVMLVTQVVHLLLEIFLLVMVVAVAAALRTPLPLLAILALLEPLL
jgi:hypothetical protein